MTVAIQRCVAISQSKWKVRWSYGKQRLTKYRQYADYQHLSIVTFLLLIYYSERTPETFLDSSAWIVVSLVRSTGMK